MARSGGGSLVGLVVSLVAVILTIQAHADTKYQRGLNEDKEASGRIIGGRPTTVRKFRWQLYILVEIANNPNDELCGGSIIDKSWILSAAHCFTKPGLERIYIYAGVPDDLNDIIGDPDVRLYEFGQQDFGATVFIHPQFNHEVHLNNDIAIFKLNVPLAYTSRIGEIPLAALSDFAPERVIASGWGETENGNTSDVLLYAKMLKLWKWKDCRKFWEGQRKDITETMICYQTHEKGACFGDSGGAVITKERKSYVQMGIISWGNEPFCIIDGGQVPNVMTNVPLHMDWIFKTISDESCPDTNDNCPTWAAEGKCSRWKIFNMCKASCACDNCRNLWSKNTCKKRKKMGHCNSKEHKLEMAINCKQTCKKCDKCKDKKANCPELAANGVCEDDRVRGICKKSCTQCEFPKVK